MHRCLYTFAGKKRPQVQAFIILKASPPGPLEPNIVLGPVFQTGRSCKKPRVKNGTNFRHTAVLFGAEDGAEEIQRIQRSSRKTGEEGGGLHLRNLTTPTPEGEEKEKEKSIIY